MIATESAPAFKTSLKILQIYSADGDKRKISDRFANFFYAFESDNFIGIFFCFCRKNRTDRDVIDRKFYGFDCLLNTVS